MRVERLGKYELVRHLASGGMASVYLARVSGLGGFERHVVVKTLHADRLADDAYVGMFLDEARLVATLHHQHVAQVYDVGRTDDGTYFLAMEYVHGETVRSLLERAAARGTPLPLELGLTIVCAAAAGLHHAHERRNADGEPLKIVHRDVSPSNVILSYDGSIKLIDFGIAKAEQRLTQTQTGFIKGKAGYMAPEQALGYEIDRRSDVFALGVLAYELTTLTQAFRAPSQFETVWRSVHGEVVPPSQVVPGYPAALESVVMTALQTDPDERFHSAEEMRRALEGIAIHLGLSLGAACVSRTLDELFGPRLEPWITEAAARKRTAAATIPMSRDAVGFARGSGENRAHDDGRDERSAHPIEEDELTTRPYVTVEATSPPALPPVPVVVSRPASIPPPVPAAIRAPVPAAIPPPVPAIIPRVLQEPPPVADAGALVARPPRVLPRRITTLALSELREAARRRGRLAIAIGGVMVATLLVLAIRAVLVDVPRSPSSPVASPVQPARPAVTRATTPTPTPTPTPRPVPAPAPKPVPTTISLRVTSDPSGATVVLDGVRLGTTPYQGLVPSKQHPGWLKVRMRHRRPIKIEVPLDRDVTWSPSLPALHGAGS